MTQQSKEQSSFLGKTYAATPMWAASRLAPMDWQPLASTWDESARIKQHWQNCARALDAQTRKPRRGGFTTKARHDRRGRAGDSRGVIGHAYLRVYDALCDHHNNKSGELYPGFDAIAERAGVCARTVARAIKWLEALGMIKKTRRCERAPEGAPFRMWQITNGYELRAPKYWKLSFVEPPRYGPTPREMERTDAHPVVADSLREAIAQVRKKWWKSNRRELIALGRRGDADSSQTLMADMLERAEQRARESAERA
jgi:Helix-turn-helix domain